MIQGQGQDTVWEYFWNRKISNTFLVCLIFLVLFFFFGGGGVTEDAGSKPTYEEKTRVPPGVSMGAELYF